MNEKIILDLVEKGKIKRVGSRKKGSWQVKEI